MKSRSVPFVRLALLALAVAFPAAGIVLAQQGGGSVLKWKCNAGGVLHDNPGQCSKSYLGGQWVAVGKVAPQDRLLQGVNPTGTPYAQPQRTFQYATPQYTPTPATLPSLSPYQIPQALPYH